MRTLKCQNHGDLASDLLTGEGSSHSELEVALQLAGCPNCGPWLRYATESEVAQEVEQGLLEAFESVVLPARGRIRRWRLASIAASVALLAGAMAWTTSEISPPTFEATEIFAISEETESAEETFHPGHLIDERVGQEPQFETPVLVGSGIFESGFEDGDLNGWT